MNRRETIAGADKTTETDLQTVAAFLAEYRRNWFWNEVLPMTLALVTMFTAAGFTLGFLFARNFPGI